jgi:hypothetical protein
MPHTTTLRRVRWMLGLFMLGLILSGITAFPLQHELDRLVAARGLEPARPDTYAGLDRWILTVHNGLRDSYARYPWIAYGTDWLAFGHLVIAVFFIGPMVNPVRNVWVLWAGLIACAGVIPLALICGAIRGIPFGWRLVDCSFGVFGAMPLVYCLRLVKSLAETQGRSQ